MNIGKEFEEYIRYIFFHILNIKDEGIEIKERHKLQGLSGEMHEFDLFYEFDKSGIIHQVGIECKNTNRPIERSEIQVFVDTLNNFRNIVGIFISKNGFQSGAKEYGKKHGLILMDNDDLPTFAQMFADRIKTVALPEESYIGEPFWAIMEINDKNRVTGSYYGTGRPFPHIPIYFSRRHAESMLEVLNKNGIAKYAVRGLTQFALRKFIITTKLMNIRIMICLKDRNTIKATDFFAFEISNDDLQQQYYYGKQIDFSL